MFPSKKIKFKEEVVEKTTPYHSENNLLSQTVQWINFLNSEKKLDENTNTLKIEEEPEIIEKLNTPNFGKFNNITKKN